MSSTTRRSSQPGCAASGEAKIERRFTCVWTDCTWAAFRAPGQAAAVGRPGLFQGLSAEVVEKRDGGEVDSPLQPPAKLISWPPSTMPARCHCPPTSRRNARQTIRPDDYQTMFADRPGRRRRCAHSGSAPYACTHQRIEEAGAEIVRVTPARWCGHLSTGESRRYRRSPDARRNW